MTQTFLKGHQFFIADDNVPWWPDTIWHTLQTLLGHLSQVKILLKLLDNDYILVFLSTFSIAFFRKSIP